MAVHAHMNPAWRNKWLLLAGIMLAFAAYCVYDATVGYPGHNEKVAAFEELEKTARLPEWPALARERGWSTEQPDPAYSEDDIATQWKMAAIFGVLAIVVLGNVLRISRTKLAAEDDALVGPGGRRVPYGEITDIDKVRWDSKGIAVVHYGENGKQRLKIDDWVYRDADLVLQEVEQRTGISKPV